MTHPTIDICNSYDPCKKPYHLHLVVPFMSNDCPYVPDYLKTNVIPHVAERVPRMRDLFDSPFSEAMLSDTALLILPHKLADRFSVPDIFEKPAPVTEVFQIPVPLPERRPILKKVLDCTYAIFSGKSLQDCNMWVPKSPPRLLEEVPCPPYKPHCTS